MLLIFCQRKSVCVSVWYSVHTWVCVSVCVFACGFCRAQFLINLFISSQKAQRLNVCLTRAPHRHAPRPLLCLPPLCKDLANLSINCRRVFSLFCTRHWPWTLPNPPREAKTEWNFPLYLKSFFFRLISWTRLVQLPESFFLCARRMNLLCLDNFFFILIVNVLVYHIVQSISFEKILIFWAILSTSPSLI